MITSTIESPSFTLSPSFSGKNSLPSILPATPASSFDLATSLFLRLYLTSSSDDFTDTITSSCVIWIDTLPSFSALILGSTSNTPAFLLFDTISCPSVFLNTDKL